MLQFELHVLTGPRSGESIPLDQKRFSIGTNAADDFQVVDETASPKHAILTSTDKSYLVCDLYSSSGVFVNGARVESAELKIDDVFNIGKTSFLFRKSTARRLKIGEASEGLPAAISFVYQQFVKAKGKTKIVWGAVLALLLGLMIWVFGGASLVKLIPFIKTGQTNQAIQATSEAGYQDGFDRGSQKGNLYIQMLQLDPANAHRHLTWVSDPWNGNPPILKGDYPMSPWNVKPPVLPVGYTTNFIRGYRQGLLNQIQPYEEYLSKQ